MGINFPAEHGWKESLLGDMEGRLKQVPDMGDTLRVVMSPDHWQELGLRAVQCVQALGSTPALHFSFRSGLCSLTTEAFQSSSVTFLRRAREWDCAVTGPLDMCHKALHVQMLQGTCRWQQLY